MKDNQVQIEYREEKLKELNLALKTFQDSLLYINGTERSRTHNQFPYINKIGLNNAWSGCISEDEREINLEGLFIKLDVTFLNGVIKSTKKEIDKLKVELKDLKLAKIKKLQQEINCD